MKHQHNEGGIVVIIGVGEVLASLELGSMSNSFDMGHQTTTSVPRNPSISLGRRDCQEEVGALEPRIFKTETVGFRDGRGYAKSKGNMIRSGAKAGG
jgi:hypothetical protein